MALFMLMLAIEYIHHKNVTTLQIIITVYVVCNVHNTLKQKLNHLHELVSLHNHVNISFLMTHRKVELLIKTCSACSIRIGSGQY